MSRKPRVPAGPPARTDSMIRCADCLHCQQFKEVGANGRYVLKVRCAMGHWRRNKTNRLEATYDLCHLLAREVRKCPEYASLSDDAEDHAAFLASLRQSLPLEPYVYEPDGTVAELYARRR